MLNERWLFQVIVKRSSACCISLQRFLRSRVLVGAQRSRVGMKMRQRGPDQMRMQVRLCKSLEFCMGVRASRNAVRVCSVRALTSEWHDGDEPIPHVLRLPRKHEDKRLSWSFRCQVGIVGSADTVDHPNQEETQDPSTARRSQAKLLVRYGVGAAHIHA